MQHSGSTGKARKEDRVPLDAIVALSFDDGGDVLEADGLDVSPRGLSLRANFVPEVGTRLQCRFHCPPNDEPVRALGEVVWGTWANRDEGTFGMEFLELDTKSATTIRRLLDPQRGAEEPAKSSSRLASMRIDGLDVPIDAEVKRSDPDCIVLEQDLTFLRLGRGVEVDVKGRGKSRGRIASIELRYGPLDVPTLVFGVLLDGARDEAPVAVVTSRRVVAPTLDAPFAEPAGTRAPLAAAARALAGKSASDSLDAPLLDAHDDTRGGAAGFDGEHADDGAMENGQDGQDDVHGHADEQADEPELADERGRGLAARGLGVREALLSLRARVALVGARMGALYARVRVQRSERAAAADGSVRESVLLRLVHSSGRVTASVQQLLSRSAQNQPRRTTTRAPARVVRAQTPKNQTKAALPEKRPRNQRLYAAAFAIIGVGVGVYALAPRSGADRIHVGEFATTASVTAPARVEAPVQQLPTVTALPSPAAAEPVSGNHASPAPKPEPVEEPATVAPFGEASVPNGRVFVLRMSGPVRALEGEAREDGFTVRVPGRLALDRASPIAAANRAVARAMVLNRGEYAELTVDFLPGMRPKYQVQGKDNTLEVTLEKP